MIIKKIVIFIFCFNMFSQLFAEDALLEMYQDYIRRGRDPSNVEMATYLYRALSRRSYYPEAIQILKELVRMFPKEIEYYNELGSLLLFGLNNKSLAKKYFLQSLEINPKQKSAYLILGDIYANQGEYDKSIQTYRKILHFDSSEESKFYVQNKVKSVHLTVNEQLFKDWWILGPFDNQDNLGLDREYPVEKSIDLNAFYVGKDGGKISWQRPFKESFGFVDLNSLFIDSDYAVSYALTYVYSPLSRDAIIMFGSDDGAKVWLNQKLVYEINEARRATCDSDQIKVHLDKGWNQLLIKVSDLWGGWGFYFRIVDKNYRSMDGIFYSSDKNKNVIYEKLKKYQFKLILSIIIKSLVYLIFMLVLSMVGYKTFKFYQFQKLKDEFIANASHDMKTPLTSIKLYAENLLSFSFPKEKQDQYLDTIINESNMLDEYINKILDMSKINSGNVTFNLEKIAVIEYFDFLTSKILEYYPHRKIKFHIDNIPKNVKINVDRQYFLRCMLNIIQNAIKFSSETKEVLVSVQLLNKRILFEVKDYGIGIPKKELKKIFKKFYRSNHSHQFKGSGLGLSIVHKIAKAHHADIEVSSAINEWTCFKVFMKAIYES